jgi:nitroreductase
MGFGAGPADPWTRGAPPSAIERPHAVEFLDVIARRRSVRHFNSKLTVSDADVTALLEAATAAPTAGNIQPWRFVVVRTNEARDRLAGALHQKWATGAPVTIAVCVDPRPCYARYSDRGERLYALQDTAAAVENILLAAVDRGLAACWVGAFDEDAVREALGVTAPITPIAIIPVGHSAEAAGRPARRPLDEVTTWL